MIFSNFNYRSDQLFASLQSRFALAEVFLLADTLHNVYDFKLSVLYAFSNDEVAVAIKNLSRKFCKSSSAISTDLINCQTGYNSSKFEKV